MPKIVDKEAKRREIMHAALKIFTTKGLHEATVSEIAKAGGIGKGTFYHYFSSKEEVVLAIWESLLFAEHAAWLEKSTGEHDSAVEKIVRYFDFSHFDTEILESAFSLYSNYLASIVSRSNDLFQKFAWEKFNDAKEQIMIYLQEGIDKGEFKEIDTNEAAEIIIHLKNGNLVSAAERGLSAHEVGKKIPTHITVFLNTIKIEERH